MRVIIKGADFSNVSIGKVVEDLNFRISANSLAEEGVYGFMNWDEDSQTVTTSDAIYRITDGVVYQGSGSSRLITDFIKVIPGMIVSLKGGQTYINGSNSIISIISCFNANKELLTDASIYAAWMNNTSPYMLNNIPFTVPEGVTYIRIISNNNTTSVNQNIYIGSMPE